MYIYTYIYTCAFKSFCMHNSVCRFTLWYTLLIFFPSPFLNFLSCPLFRFVHRNLEVFGNAFGCVQGVPDSVTSFDYHALSYGYYETARCGDNCTQHTVYVPSDGVCVQCPDGTHAHGVGAVNCTVLSPTRCSLVQLTCCSALQCGAVCCNVAVQCPRGVLLCN